MGYVPWKQRTITNACLFSPVTNFGGVRGGVGGLILILMQQLQSHTHKTNSQFKGKLALLEAVFHSRLSLVSCTGTRRILWLFNCPGKHRQKNQLLISKAIHSCVKREYGDARAWGGYSDVLKVHCQFDSTLFFFVVALELSNYLPWKYRSNIAIQTGNIGKLSHDAVTDMWLWCSRETSIIVLLKVCDNYLNNFLRSTYSIYQIMQIHLV